MRFPAGIAQSAVKTERQKFIMRAAFLAFSLFAANLQ